MPALIGFGYDPFGYFPFGGVEWAKTVTTDVIPGEIIAADNDPTLAPPQPLQNFLLVVRALVEPLRLSIDNLLSLRDPLNVPLFYPIDTFLRVGVGDKVATVANPSLTGAVTFTAGITNVAGVGTIFTEELIVGNFIGPYGTGFGTRVLQIVSDTLVVLEAVYNGPTVTTDEAAITSETGVVLFMSPFTADPQTTLPAPAAYTTFDTRLVVQLPLALEQVATRADYLIFASTDVDLLPAVQVRDSTTLIALGNDYGVAVDDSDIEPIQRSSIENQNQFLDLKGTALSYETFGKIYGYQTSVFPLWCVNISVYSQALLELEGVVFETFPGSGVWLTNVPPYNMLFDDTPADVEPLDIPCTSDLLVTYPMTITSVSGVGDQNVTVTGSLVGVTAAVPGMNLVQGENVFRIVAMSSPGMLTVEPLTAGVVPVMGAADLVPQCYLEENCDYCKTAFLLIQIQAIPNYYSAPTAVDRIIDRLATVTPEHVTLIRVEFITEFTIDVNPSVSGTTLEGSSSPVAVVYHFDVIPADVTPIDSPALVWGTGP